MTNVRSTIPTISILVERVEEKHPRAELDRIDIHTELCTNILCYNTPVLENKLHQLDLKICLILQHEPPLFTPPNSSAAWQRASLVDQLPI